MRSISNTIHSFFNSRSAETGQISLSHRTVYIVPSKASLGALSIVIILLIAGMNYQNNLLYIFAFWLLALIIWNFILGFYNLYHLTLTAVQTKNNFEGEPVQFQVALSTKKKSSRQFFLQLNAFFNVKKGGEIFAFDLNKNDRELWVVETESKQRGPLKLPRIYIYSTYPFGFAYAFSYVHLDLCAWAYPKPKEFQHDIEAGGNSPIRQQIRPRRQSQGVDFYALKSYETGDKIQRIHWRQYAKTGALLTKQFANEGGDNVWIRWQDFYCMPTEDRLRHLSFLIQQACEYNQTYGLEMPTRRIEPHYGEIHKHQCLLLLAKYGFVNAGKLVMDKQGLH